MPTLLTVRKLRDITDNGPYGLLVESTAPLNVEEGFVSPIATDLVNDEGLSNSETLTQACKRLANSNQGADDLSIVVQVHGFNNPAKVAYIRYGQAWDHYRDFGGNGLLYVGYRWPGEAMGSTLNSSFRALPGATFFLFGFSIFLLFLGIYITKAADNSGPNWPWVGQLIWYGMALGALVGGLAAMTKIGSIIKASRKGISKGIKSTIPPASFNGPLTLLLLCLVLALCLIFLYKNMAPFDWGAVLQDPRKVINVLCSFDTSAPILIGGLLASLPVVVLLFRVLVYFRDAYRAEHFGVQDLVEFIRHLDAELDKQMEKTPERRVSLSLIGHSMGALVVTGTVRILSDVFDQTSLTDLNTGQGSDPSSRIGKRLQLGNLVLVSPDIPAEALLSGRANFLAASIRRFREGHLFSNEGDVVVRAISSIGNAFSFPSSTSKHGQRLANTHVTWNPGATKPPFGIVNPIDASLMPQPLPQSKFLDLLYVGRYKITEIKEGLASQQSPDTLAPCLNYFDCTDYRGVPDDSAQGNKLIPALTYARRTRFVSISDLVLLMVNYLRVGWFMPEWRKDVHSAYFDFPETRTLIYSSAHGGLRHAIGSMSSSTDSMADQVAAFHERTATLGLQSLLSLQSIKTLYPEDAPSAL